ncbi:MAG: hypothetical protein DCC49_09030 [Acidobacteria bacterium]|nr:MAG: hypothetical protein DCC49_09030 [Acidobacteriota bacterium]
MFRDFTWPSDLTEFGRFNLIYGWNGSGKTTISRVLRALETRTAPSRGQVIVRIDGQDVSGDEFPQATLPVRVFNRDFVAENVFSVEGGELRPIYVFGKESVEKQKELDRLTDRKATAEADLSLSKSKKQNAENDFDKFCIDRAKVVKDTLRSSGSNPYNDYDKARYRQRAQEMVADDDVSAHSLAETERDNLRAQHQATQKPKVDEVTFAFPDFAGISARASELLTATVLSAAIRPLKDDPTLSEWTRDGLTLHRDRKAEQCLFCEQSLPSDRLATLEAHFNAEYEGLMQLLDEQVSALQDASTDVSKLKLPVREKIYDDLGAKYDEAAISLTNAVSATKSFLDAVVEALTDKRNRPFESVDFNTAEPAVDSEAVDRLNGVLRDHNRACDDFQARLDNARKRLADDMIAEELEEFVRLRIAVQQANDDVKDSQQEIQRLNEDIARLEREIVEHRQPADQLTEDLHRYLGHDELRLEINETGYAITRGGVQASALSEGESTAIALLYFLKLLEDRRFDPAASLVVLDDPVSSLDANSLYLAFGLIQRRTQDVAQLIILTHNFTFFRLVRNWFHHLKGRNKAGTTQRPAQFYMLDCTRTDDQRCARIRALDPLLEQYESEYQYLFSRIYHAANSASAAELEENYALPNMARRLLETFLAFRQPHTRGQLRLKMDAVDFDPERKTRILRFLHTASHGDAVGDPEHDLSLLAEANSVLTDLLELMKAEDPKHFSALVELVNPPVREEGDR